MKAIFQMPASFSRKADSSHSLVHGGAGGVGDTALIDVSHPSRLAADVDVRLGHIPFVVHARGMLCLDGGHDGVSIESGAYVIYVKVLCNDGVELRNVIRTGCGKCRAHCVYDLRLIGSDRFLPGSRDKENCRKR
jgi:hypothetical protein